MRITNCTKLLLLQLQNTKTKMSIFTNVQREKPSSSQTVHQEMTSGHRISSHQLTARAVACWESVRDRGAQSWGEAAEPAVRKMRSGQDSWVRCWFKNRIRGFSPVHSSPRSRLSCSSSHAVRTDLALLGSFYCRFGLWKRLEECLNIIISYWTCIKTKQISS